mmetsp:Transcript_8447/g.11074  ORF Transcript_8447/g.11074 Transcript_8447/m.11074 type:complete len:375 (+) Transcript_8447:23-1147(+)
MGRKRKNHNKSQSESSLAYNGQVQKIFDSIHDNDDAYDNSSSQTPVKTGAKKKRRRKKRKGSSDILGKNECSSQLEGQIGSTPEFGAGNSPQKKKRQKRKRKTKKSNDSTLAKSGPNEGAVLPIDLSRKKHCMDKTNHQGGIKNAQNKSKLKLSTLQQKMRAKLDGARFRMINEELYTRPSTDSFSNFQNDPSLFDVYHTGFREQVEKWPVNPLDVIINWVSKKQCNKIIVDFGCGEARLAQSVPNKVHSFDLVAANEYITACDMANVPLKDGTADVAIFCLALMGSNLADFIREAHRVLKKGGIMKIAEVRSRFESQETGLQNFVQVIQQLGFSCNSKDQSNKMFIMMEFTKKDNNSNPSIHYSAKPCIYKRR